MYSTKLLHFNFAKLAKCLSGHCVDNHAYIDEPQKNDQAKIYPDNWSVSQIIETTIHINFDDSLLNDEKNR